jgi:hypothetical protein
MERNQTRHRLGVGWVTTTDDAEQIFAGERGVALFATGLVRRRLRAAARAT